MSSMCFVPERTRRATDCSRNVTCVIYHLTKVKGYTLAGAKMALKEKFSEYEERVIMLETLDKTRKFLTGLDQSLAEKLKG